MISVEKNRLYSSMIRSGVICSGSTGSTNTKISSDANRPAWVIELIRPWSRLKAVVIMTTTEVTVSRMIWSKSISASELMSCACFSIRLLQRLLQVYCICSGKGSGKRYAQALERRLCHVEHRLRVHSHPDKSDHHQREAQHFNSAE